MTTIRQRRFYAGLILIAVALLLIIFHPNNYRPHDSENSTIDSTGQSALSALGDLAVKGRAPKTGYQRSQFGNGWSSTGSCDTRNRILYRDLTETVVDSQCHVVSGILDDPYTGATIQFVRGAETSQLVQIDHVVALSDAWQKGAQELSSQRRIDLANDDLNLLAVDGQANSDKGDGDAATWLPANKSFRCQYIARQIAVKHRYDLWVTSAEADAMRRVLSTCPGQALPQQ